ncbi:hypothetical protein [Streptomyces sp. BE230]|uniref:hypothetical protein n=1 Tax=Streptomyces sp. BE230 TaxID=3002526 RepID=UPI002ECFDD09|nr:hypothetical protein [Streptomyces sp. BE230]
MTHAAELRTAAQRTPDTALAALLAVLADATEHPSDAAIGLMGTVLHPALAVARLVRDTTPTDTDLRDRITQAVSGADDHSCQMQDGVDYRALADAALSVLRRATQPELKAAVLPAPVDRAAPAPLCEVWAVWCEDESVWAYFATVEAARQGTIDCWEENEPVCPDYSWSQDGPRLELLVGGEHGGVYASRHRVYGTPETAPTDRRARYAAAIRDTDGWVLDDGQHMVDAVMAVADTEQAALRAEAEGLDEALRGAIAVSEKDGARLRAEVERLRADRATVRAVIRRLAAHAVGFQDVLDEGDQGAWGKTIGADIAELRRLADEAQQPETEAGGPCPHCRHISCRDRTPCNAILSATGLDMARCPCTGEPAADQPDTKTEARTGDDRCPGFCIPCMTDESHHPATEEPTR